MRKLFALALVALLALTMALAVVGCGQKKEEPAATGTETAPPAETMSESTMTDTAAADTMRH
jgi:uncharacterized lipoprotein YehR (DUF1307 family)